MLSIQKMLLRDLFDNDMKEKNNKVSSSKVLKRYILNLLFYIYMFLEFLCSKRC